MTQEQITALALFVLVGTITPGPNNLMLMASGANFGALRTLPHMFGISFGMIVMVSLVGIGLMGLLEAWPAAGLALKATCVVYLLWLAWKIATAAPPSAEAAAARRPFSFLQAALFQWVNPKAWTIALTGITVYAPSRDLHTILAVTLAFGLIGLPAIALWALLGQNLRRFLSNPRRLRVFNAAIALLLVSSLWPVLLA